MEPSLNDLKSTFLFGNPLQYSCLENAIGQRSLAGSIGQRSLAGYTPWGCKSWTRRSDWATTFLKGLQKGSPVPFHNLKTCDPRWWWWLAPFIELSLLVRHPRVPISRGELRIVPVTSVLAAGLRTQLTVRPSHVLRAGWTLTPVLSAFSQAPSSLLVYCRWPPCFHSYCSQHRARVTDLSKRKPCHALLYSESSRGFLRHSE